MPTSAELLLDTSAALALVLGGHAHAVAVTVRTQGRILGLAGHAETETYSVLTRLPGALRLSADGARRVLERNFPATHRLSAGAAAGAVARLAHAGVSGGAAYDGLVALAAEEAGVRLLTCDRRALGTYASLEVAVELIS